MQMAFQEFVREQLTIPASINDAKIKYAGTLFGNTSSNGAFTPVSRHYL